MKTKTFLTASLAAFTALGDRTATMTCRLRTSALGLLLAIAAPLACSRRELPRTDSGSASSTKGTAATPTDDAGARSNHEFTDSTLLEQDLDGSGVTDRLVQQVKFTVVGRDTVNLQRQLALLLDSAKAPAWASGFDQFDSELARPPIRLPSAGSLVVIHSSEGDADEFTVVDVHAGLARAALQHQIDYGRGQFSITEDSGRVVVTATREVKVGDETKTASVPCSANEWPAFVLVFDDHRRMFVAERQQCVPQE